MKIGDELNFYDEKMLRLQYEISECFSHQLTKGEIREEFIKEYIKNKTGNDKILKGAIYKGIKESTQLDIIICNNNVIYNKCGSHYLIDAEDCKIVFEIKSKLNNEYLKKLSKVSKNIKMMNSKIKVGMFAYCLGQGHKSILEKFGYKYDQKLEMYEYDTKNILREYKYIDYVVCIDENYEFVIINENGKFVLYTDIPIIKYLWPILKN